MRITDDLKETATMRTGEARATRSMLEGDQAWKRLYQVGGAAAMGAAAFALLQAVIEAIGVGLMHIEVPSTVAGWFALLQSQWLFGITALTFFQIPAFALCVPVFLALYAALRQTTERAYVAIAIGFAFVGLAVYLASNTAISMLPLSDEYAAATTEAQRSISLAAGQAMLAIYQGPGIDVGLFLIMLSIVMISAVMLRSRVFGRATGYAGIATGVLALAYYIVAFFSALAIFIFELAGVCFVVWLVLAGRRLLQMGDSNATLDVKGQ